MNARKVLYWFPVLLAAAQCLGQTGTVEVAGAPSVATTMQVQHDGHPAVVDVQTLRVRLMVPDKKPVDGEVVVLREPNTGSVWWGFLSSETWDALADLRSRATFFLIGQRFVGFYYFPVVLGFMRCRSAARPSMRGVLALSGTRAGIRRFGNQLSWDRIPLRTAVPRSFVVNGESSEVFGDVKLLRIEPAGGGWKVVLAGPNGDSPS